MGEVLATGKLGIIFGLPDLYRTSVLAGRLTIETVCSEEHSQITADNDLFSFFNFSFEVTD